MGIFDFLKGKKKESKETEDKILLAMPLFAEGKSYDLDAVLKRLEEHWQQKVTDKSGDGGSAVFSVNGYMVAMAFMPVAVPGGDIEGTLPYTYIWTTAKEECSTHKGHAIVSLLSKEGSLIERYKIFTMVLESVLATSDAIGIYQGTQTILLSKKLYMHFADLLNQGISPVNLWVYIGLRGGNSGMNAYTYGLKQFGKQEIEILNSDMKPDEIFDFIRSIVAYIIEGDVTLNDGETVGFSAEQKIKIKASKGIYVEGESLKLQV